MCHFDIEQYNAILVNANLMDSKPK